MALSRKHFETLAKIISDIPDCTIKHDVAVDVADFCGDENPFFDRAKFYKAAGLDELGYCSQKPQ